MRRHTRIGTREPRSYVHTRSSTPGDGEPGTGSREILPTPRLMPTPGIEDPLQHPTIRIPPSPPKETTGRSPVAKTLFTLSKNHMSDGDVTRPTPLSYMENNSINSAFANSAFLRDTGPPFRHLSSCLVEPIGVEPTTS
jgi:hypothetical protein